MSQQSCCSLLSLHQHCPERFLQCTGRAVPLGLPHSTPPLALPPSLIHPWRLIPKNMCLTCSLLELSRSSHTSLHALAWRYGKAGDVPTTLSPPPPSVDSDVKYADAMQGCQNRCVPSRHTLRMHEDSLFWYALIVLVVLEGFKTRLTDGGSAA